MLSLTELGEASLRCPEEGSAVRAIPLLGIGTPKAMARRLRLLVLSVTTSLLRPPEELGADDSNLWRFATGAIGDANSSLSGRGRLIVVLDTEFGAESGTCFDTGVLILLDSGVLILLLDRETGKAGALSPTAGRGTLGGATTGLLLILMEGVRAIVMGRLTSTAGGGPGSGANGAAGLGLVL
jgi:hypothetical protein